MSLNDTDKLYRQSMPPQKIALKKKGEKWQKDCIDYVIGQSSAANMWCNNPHRISVYNENNDVYEGIINEDDLKYITNPFNVDDKLPARLKEFNIIKPLIDSMLGEEVNRPFKFAISRSSENAKTDYQEQAKQMLIDYFNAAVTMNLDPQYQKEYDRQIQAGEIMPPEEIQRWMNESYKDIAEEFNCALLKYLINKLEAKTAFMRGYKDLLLNREEVYFVGEEYGHPNLRWVNPATFCYEYFPDMQYIEEASWCAERIVCSWAELHDRFKGELTDSELDEIMSWFEGRGGSTYGAGLSDKDPYSMGVYHEQRIELTNMSFPFNNASADTIPLWKVHWKSYRKIYFVTTNNPENNHPETNVVDENYVFTGEEEEVEEEWIMEVWQGYRCGDVYFGCRPISVVSDHEDPTSVTIPYVGLAAQGKSIVEHLKPMAMAYISLWYRLDLMLSRDNGRALVMDVTQIPKSMGFDVSRWAHVLKSMGVVLINPYENAWDIPGRDGSRPSSFNAFSALDLSMSQSINMYIELINRVEQMAQQVIGFNPQRLGQVGHRDLQGTTQEALNQSYNTNALLVYMHDMVKQRALRKLLNVALAIRYREDDLFLSFVGNDGLRMYLDMPNTALETMDLFISSSAEEQKKIEQLKQLYQPALQNGATLVDVLHIMESDNITEIRLKLEEIEMRKQQMMQQQQQAEQQQKQAEMESVEKDRQYTADSHNADRQLKKYIVDAQNQTKIQVAEIQAQLKSQEMELGQNVDPMEQAKLELEQQKLAGDQELKQQATEHNYHKMISELDLKSRDMELRQQQILSDMQFKMSEADQKRVSDWKQLDLKEQEVDLKRRQFEHDMEQIKLQHKLEMEKLRAEFIQQLKVIAKEELHEMKVKKSEMSHEKRVKQMEQRHEKVVIKEQGQIDKTKQKIADAGKRKITLLQEDAKKKLEQMKISEERRKERKAEEKAAKAAKEKKKNNNSGGSSGGSNGGSSSSGGGNSNNGSSNNNTPQQTNGPQITITRIGL